MIYSIIPKPSLQATIAWRQDSTTFRRSKAKPEAKHSLWLSIL